jgi:hypothetical protein
VLPLHHGPSSTPGVDSSSRPRLGRSKLTRQRGATGVRGKPPAGLEPALRPYKGRVLAVHTTEARRWRRRESNPLLLGASEAPCHQSFVPRCGRMESNHHSTRRRVYSAGSSPMLSVRKKMGWPAGFEPAPRGSRPRMLPSTPRPPGSGDDRTRTGGLSPDKRALCAAELRPHEVARVGFEPTISSS